MGFDMEKIMIRKKSNGRDRQAASGLESPITPVDTEYMEILNRANACLKLQ